jgi:hypothetical protein
MIFPKETVSIPFTIKIGGKEIVTSYALNALANNPVKGYGKVTCTVINSAGVIANDANGVLLDRQYANCIEANSGKFAYAIGPGLLPPDEYEAQGWYGVLQANGTDLDWRGLGTVTFKVEKKTVEALPPV